MRAWGTNAQRPASRWLRVMNALLNVVLGKGLKVLLLALALLALSGTAAHASEAVLAIPDLRHGEFAKLGGIDPWHLLLYGAFVICGTLGISLFQLVQIK